MEKSRRSTPEGNVYMGTFSDAFGQKSTFDYQDFKLIGQIGENASIVKTLQAQSVEEVRPKVFVYDMGQNMVGFPQIQIKNGQKGQVITMRYAEIKYPNLDTYKGNEGMIMMENIRAALTTDQYILKGGDEVIQPRFTFHGYRYLEITGIPQAIPVGDIKGLVISSVNELSSSYETSDPLVNKLWQNITWSLRSNFLSIPTDTPARNERMGWSGDISVFSKTATYLTDANSFLRRHLLAMRDVQDDNGRFTDVAPLGGGFGGTLWGSAGIVVAWETYRQYGDIQLLGEHFNAMKKYINFLESKIDKNTGILNEGPLGDWLSPEGNKNDNTLFWMAYFSYDLNIMSQMASILGKTDEAIALKKRSEEIKKAFNDIYIDKNSHRTVRSGLKTGFWGAPNEKEGTGKTDKGVIVDTQASYAIPLALDVFDEANKPFAIKYLNEAVSRTNKDDSGIERPNYSLMTGFIGTASISEALSVNGNHDLAYKLLTNKQYPSWLYSVVNGATSIWERLNSYTVENGFGGNNSMNSFNHYSFGAVAAWMYNYSLGIQRHPEKLVLRNLS
jgi:alpha-L-rhamnosidase